MAARLRVFCLLLLFVVDLTFAHKHIDESSLKDVPSTCHIMSSSKHCNRITFCDWCLSEAVPSGCYHVSETNNLAKSVFTCSKRDAQSEENDEENEEQEDKQQLLKPAADPCEGKSQADCQRPTCVWCKSSAVPSACYTPAQAAHLPPAVFDCRAPSTSTSTSNDILSALSSGMQSVVQQGSELVASAMQAASETVQGAAQQGEEIVAKGSVVAKEVKDAVIQASEQVKRGAGEEAEGLAAAGFQLPEKKSEKKDKKSEKEKSEKKGEKKGEKNGEKDKRRHDKHADKEVFKSAKRMRRAHRRHH